MSCLDTDSGLFGIGRCEVDMDKHYISRRLRQDRGQALIEFILILPMIFLLIVNLVNFGGFFYSFITVANAARAGANYAVLGFFSVGTPSTPTGPQITAVVRQDLSSLPNSTAATINVCKNNGVTVKVLSGSCTSIPSDPESASYVLTSVDVTYTYSPFIPLFSFPGLGVYLTLPPTTLYQRVAMRNY
jgi:Flp pilus assembly protein TadG